jgi:hypothetical protein
LFLFARKSGDVAGEMVTMRLAVKTACLLLAVTITAPQAVAQASAQTASTTPKETYASAAIDADGNLRIVTTARKVVVIPRGSPPKSAPSSGRQTAFDMPVLSEDRSAVAAPALFKNCCTSYDIPLQLVVYSQGRTHRFEGGLAIFDWHFADGGRRIVFSQQTVHFACSVHWELRDVASERLLAAVDIAEACGENPNPPQIKPPEWVSGTTSGFR